jgi:hypothetical protein
MFSFAHCIGSLSSRSSSFAHPIQVLTRSVVLGAIAPLALSLGMIAGAQAPTVHYSPSILTLGGGFSSPSGVAADSSGSVYVAETGNNAVKEVPVGCASASCVTTLANGFGFTAGVALDNGGICI